MAVMAKSIKQKKHSTSPAKQPKVEEPFAVYRSVKKLPLPTEFSFKRFEKVTFLVPFTQKEWAGILHLSERTLQRYSKENSSFDGIYTDKILHIEQMIEMGLETFINSDAFYEWLKKEKNVLGSILNFQSLSSMQGIQQIIDQLARIQYGVYT